MLILSYSTREIVAICSTLLRTDFEVHSGVYRQSCSEFLQLAFPLIFKNIVVSDPEVPRAKLTKPSFMVHELVKKDNIVRRDFYIDLDKSSEDLHGRFQIGEHIKCLLKKELVPIS